MDFEKAMKKRRKRRRRSRQSEGATIRDEQHDDAPVGDEGTEPSPGSHPRGEHAIKLTEKGPNSSRKGDIRKCRKPRRHDGSMKDRAPASALNAATPPSKHAFEVDATDHYETPLEAYQDITKLLDQIAKFIGKTRSSLSIYDPYYCDGGVRVKPKSLGFCNVRNDNEDFYNNFENGTVPKFDVLVTNPPYSGIHVEKLLSFVAKNSQAILIVASTLCLHEGLLPALF